MHEADPIAVIQFTTRSVVLREPWDNGAPVVPHVMASPPWAVAPSKTALDIFRRWQPTGTDASHAAMFGFEHDRGLSVR